MPTTPDVRPLWPWSLGGTLAASVLLLASYRYLIYPQYDYLGYHWQDPDIALLGLTLVELLVIARFLPGRITRTSHFMLWAIFITVVLPVLLICNVMGLLSAPQIAGVCFFVGLAFSIAMAMARWGESAPQVALPHVSSRTFWWLIGGFIAATLLVLVAVNGVRTTVSDIFSVYEVRDEYKLGLAAFPPLAYMVPTAGYVAIPLVLIRGLHRKSLPLIGVAIVLQVFLYAQTGFKTYLFGIPVIICLALMIRRQISGAIVAGGIAIGVLITAAMDVFTNNVVFSSLFTRRFLATPGQIAAYYFDFFADHRFVLLSEGPLSGLVSYPFDLPVAFMIGRNIHGVETNSSNVNFFADGFAQGGWLGVVLAGILFGLLLMAVDWASSGLPVSVGAMLMFLPCIVLGNASIITSLLSHGVIAAIIVLAFAPRSGWQGNQRPPRQRNLLTSRAQVS